MACTIVGLGRLRAQLFRGSRMNKIVGFVLLGVIILLLGFDLFMIIKYGANNTISSYVYTITKEWPILTFLAGVVAGHFWFSMKFDSAPKR